MDVKKFFETEISPAELAEFIKLRSKGKLSPSKGKHLRLHEIIRYITEDAFKEGMHYVENK